MSRMMKTAILLSTILETMSRKKYIIFDDINIVGIRAKERREDSFDDLICIFWKEKDEYIFKAFKATTVPGRQMLQQPINEKGCAILVPNQYMDCWALGLHKGKYEALVQVKPVKVYRDKNKDEIIDMIPETIEKGVIGLNLHRANEWHESVLVGNWSAGCQVIAIPDEYKVFLQTCKLNKPESGFFSYTLLKEEDISNEKND